MSSVRVNFIDFIKGAAIMAVVFGHIGCFGDSHKLLPIKSFFAYAWHVPVFFMVAGFFLKDVTTGNVVTYVKKKFKQLYLLALYFYLPAVLLHNAFYELGWYDSMANSVSWTTHFDGIGALLKYIALVVCCAGREPMMGAMWFLYTLLFAMMGYGAISLLTNRLQKKGGAKASFWCSLR